MNYLLLQTLWDQSAVGIVQASLAGRWLEVNQRLCEITGYTRVELIALGGMQITHPDDHLDSYAIARDLVETGRKHLVFEKRYRHKNGSYVWVNVTLTLVRENDRPSYFVGVIEDIDSRKATEDKLRTLSANLERQVQQRTQELHTLLLNSYDAFISTDERGHIVDWNAQAETLFGWKLAEVIGRSLSLTLIPPEYRETHRRGVEEFLRSQESAATYRVRRVRYRVLRRDGSAIFVEVSLCPLPSPTGGYRYGALFHALSDRDPPPTEPKTPSQ